MKRLVIVLLALFLAVFSVLVLYAWQQLRHGVVVYVKRPS